MKVLVFQTLQSLNLDRKFIYRILIILFSVLFFNSCHRDLDNSTNVITPTIVPISTLTLYYSGDGMIQIGWYSYDLNYTKFIIYCSNSDKIGSYRKVGETTQSSFTIKNLSYDSTYYVAVTIWYNGYESDFSNIIITKPVNKNPPMIPSYLSVSGLNYEGALSMNLSWAKNTESDLAKYYIYRLKGDESSNYVKIAETTENYYVDTIGLVLNMNYSYRIAAVDKGGLISAMCTPVSDLILDTVSLIYPINNYTVRDYVTFRWNGVKNANGYKIILLNSKYGTEIWKKTVYSSNKVTYEVNYDGDPLIYKKNYYWKVCAFTKESSVLNSYSQPQTFYFVYSE